MPEAQGPPLSEMIRRRLPEFPHAERKVGRALSVGPPTLGLESSTHLGELVGASGPTVIRFVNRLGFGTYADFQQAWREQLDARFASPAEVYAKHRPETDAAARVARRTEGSCAAIRDTFEQLPNHELELAAELLSGAPGRVIVFGGWFTQVLAHHLAALLQEVRPDVVLLEPTPSGRATVLVDVTKRDVAVAFDFRRYESDTLVVARHLAGRRARVIALTDRWRSPVAEVSTAVLVAATEPAEPFESLVPALVLVEMLVATVVDALGSTVGPRLQALSQIAGALIPAWSRPDVSNTGI